MRQVGKDRTGGWYRMVGGTLAALLMVAEAAAAPAVAGPADPYIDKYGAEICDALGRNPSHDEIIRAIVAVRDNVQLSDEDATLVVADSVSRLCPQYLNLVYRAD